ncbi:MAG: hypothetical protein OXR62_01410 [Ahrensia sp.]|nr:hypothetical protein [Ahrensia sp.]
MADAAYVDTVALCRPYLEQLSEETGETIDLSRYHRSAMIFVDQVQGRHRLRAVSSVGEVFPLTTTANGLAALSIMSDQDVIEATEAECIVRRIDTSALIQKLNEIRSMGMAYDIDRHTVGISAVGFAFVDRFKVIHAISVPIPSSRYDEAHQKVEAALLSVQDAIVQLHE